MRKQPWFWPIILSITICNACLLISDYNLTQKLSHSNELNKKKLQAFIIGQREILRKDLEEKRRAEYSSLEEMSRRLKDLKEH